MFWRLDVRGVCGQPGGWLGVRGVCGWVYQGLAISGLCGHLRRLLDAEGASCLPCEEAGGGENACSKVSLGFLYACDFLVLDLVWFLGGKYKSFCLRCGLWVWGVGVAMES